MMQSLSVFPVSLLFGFSLTYISVQTGDGVSFSAFYCFSHLLNPEQTTHALYTIYYRYNILDMTNFEIGTMICKKILYFLETVHSHPDTFESI